MREYLIAFFVLLSGAVFASQELLQGELNITNFDTHVDLVDYRIYAGFSDYSLGGFVGTSIVTGNLVSVETGDGSVDFYAVTNVVSAGVNNVVLDVLYAQPGSSTLGVAATVAGLESLSTNSVGFPQQPSPEFCHLSQNHLNQIRNYAFTRIQSGGGSGTLTNEVDPVFTGWLDTNTYVKSNPGWLTNVVGYIPTDDASVTNARPWDSPNYNTITNPPAIPSTNDLASTNWVIAQGFLTDYTETDSIATNMISAASNHLELVKLNTNGNAIGLTNNVKWDTAATDASYATNWIATNIPGGSGSGFPLTSNANLAGFIMSNGSFIGNGSGLTGVNATNATALGGVVAANFATGTPVYVESDPTIEKINLPFLTSNNTFLGTQTLNDSRHLGRLDIGNAGAHGEFGTIITNLFTGSDDATLDFLYETRPGPYPPTNPGIKLRIANGGVVAPLRLLVGTNTYSYAVLNNSPVFGVYGASFFEGNIDLRASSITNIGAASVASLQVTGGATNGAQLICTDTSGQIAYSVYPIIWASQTNKVVFTDGGTTNLRFEKLEYQRGGSWDGKNWTPGVIGKGHIYFQEWAICGVPGVTYGKLYRDGALILNSDYHSFVESLWAAAVNFNFYNSNATSVYYVALYNGFIPSGSPITNTADSTKCYFFGEITP